MGSQFPHAALRQYQNAGAVAEAAFASPHRLIDMLLTGALDRLAAARGHLMRQEVPHKLAHINAVLSILEYLRMSLDFEAGGSVAQNLGQLYDYMLKRLLQANADNDPAGLDEVSGLMRTLKSGWDAIPQASPTRH
mgnify:CR=1 FL=1